MVSCDFTAGQDNLEEVLLTVPPARDDGLPWRVLVVDSPTSKNERDKTSNLIHHAVSVVPNDGTAVDDDYLVTIPDAANPGDTVRWAPPGTSRRLDFIVPPNAARTLNVATPRKR